jgi:hypothetical protein
MYIYRTLPYDTIGHILSFIKIIIYYKGKEYNYDTLLYRWKDYYNGKFMWLPNIQIYSNLICRIPEKCNINILRIKDNIISKIPYLCNIHELYIEGHNTISKIPTGTKIRKLYIDGHNTISEIPKDCNIHELHIYGYNTISKIPTGTKIRKLYIDGHNTISEIPKDIYMDTLRIDGKNNNILQIHDNCTIKNLYLADIHHYLKFPMNCNIDIMDVYIEMDVINIWSNMRVRLFNIIVYSKTIIIHNGCKIDKLSICGVSPDVIINDSCKVKYICMGDRVKLNIDIRECKSGYINKDNYDYNINELNIDIEKINVSLCGYNTTIDIDNYTSMKINC